MTTAFRSIFPNRTLLLIMTEILVIGTALRTTIYVCGAEEQLREEASALLLRVTLASGVCLLCMHYFDLYDPSILWNPREVGVRLVRVAGGVFLVLAIVYYVFPELGLNLRSFVAGMALAFVSVGVWRRLFFVLARSAGMTEKLLFLGDGPFAESLAEEFARRPHMGMTVIGCLGNLATSSDGRQGLRNLGGVERLAKVVAMQHIDRVVVTMMDRRGSLPVEALLHLIISGVRIQDGTDLYETVTGKVPVGAVRPGSLLFAAGLRVSRGAEVCKRVVGFFLSLFALIIASPVMAVISLIIWMDSGLPVIFRQTRIGKDGARFTLFKFRSMLVGVDVFGLQPAEQNDPRFTRVGKWLRRARLDELPQLYNILRGDMNFVGPRPFVPQQEEECARQIPLYSQRWCVRPGVTGWAQVRRGYCQSIEDNTEKLGYDLFYIKHMSIGLDMLVLCETAKVLLWGRGAL